MGNAASKPAGMVGGYYGGVAGAGGSGVNSMLSPFGLGGEQGEYYRAGVAPKLIDPNDSQAYKNQASIQGVNADNNVQNQLQSYGLGNQSLQDTLNNSGQNGINKQGFDESLATNPLTGSKLATDQVQSNPILGQLFGNKGELSNSISTEQNLQKQGFNLQPQDVEAYGQESGNIARLFGQSENGLAQSLASRGLSAGPNGAAGAQFSGLNGNKNEQLAQAQMQIANDRMKNTMQRIGQQQQLISSLGGQANTAINNQYGRNLAGVENSQGQRQNMLNYEADRANNLNNAGLKQYGLQEGANQESQQSKELNKGKTLFGAIGQGLYGGTSAGVSKATSNAIGSGGFGA